MQRKLQLHRITKTNGKPKRVRSKSKSSPHIEQIILLDIKLAIADVKMKQEENKGKASAIKQGAITISTYNRPIYIY